MTFVYRGPVLDGTDRQLLALLQQDASQSYAALGQAVGLSGGAAHDRVRKLRERGTIRRTTIEVDAASLGRGVLAFVLIEADAWVGDAVTADALRSIPSVVEAYVVAGAASLLVKIRTAHTADLQVVLRQIYDINGVTRAETVVALETFFERPPDPRLTAEETP